VPYTAHGLALLCPYAKELAIRRWNMLLSLWPGLVEQNKTKNFNGPAKEQGVSYGTVRKALKLFIINQTSDGVI